MTDDHPGLLAACEDAAEAFRAALGDRFGDAASVTYAEARAWELAGQPGRALQTLRRALGAADAQPWPHAMNAVIRLAEAEGSLAAAGAWLAELAAAPGMALAGLWAGHVLSAIGSNEAAVTVFIASADALAAVLPAQAAALRINAAGLLIGGGQLEAARSQADAALALEPAAAAAHFVRGCALWHLGQPDPARQAFAAATAHDPTLAERVAQVTGEPGQGAP